MTTLTTRTDSDTLPWIRKAVLESEIANATKALDRHFSNSTFMVSESEILRDLVRFSNPYETTCQDAQGFGFSKAVRDVRTTAWQGLGTGGSEEAVSLGGALIALSRAMTEELWDQDNVARRYVQRISAFGDVEKTVNLITNVRKGNGNLRDLTAFEVLLAAADFCPEKWRNRLIPEFELALASERYSVVDAASRALSSSRLASRRSIDALRAAAQKWKGALGRNINKIADRLLAEP